jgi:outer membrane protein assembly factor BamB
VDDDRPSAGPDREPASTQVPEMHSDRESAPQPPTGVEGGRPPRRRHAAWAWVVPSVLAIALVAGLTAPAVIGAGRAARGGADPTLLDVFPLEPGSTWVYDTTTNGNPTGTDVSQVTGKALVQSLAPNTYEVTDTFENFVGSGSPLKLITYEGFRGSEVVTYGQRIGTLTGTIAPGSTPPEIVARLPLEPGRSWTWRGTSGTAKGVTRTTVLRVEPRTALGRSFEGCIELRAVNRSTDAQGVASTDVLESWECPTVGVVDQHEVFTKQGQRTVFAKRLAEVHTPGLNLPFGRAPARRDFAPQRGAAPGVDDGHSGFVPGARLTAGRLAWSVARKEDILYPPVATGDARACQGEAPPAGEPCGMVLAEDDGTVSSLDVRTGQVRWQVRLSGPIVASPVATGGLVLVADSTRSLWALDAADGTARWVTRLPDVVSTAPLVTGRVVVVPVDDRSLRGLDLGTGREVWSASVANRVLSPPVLADGLVVVGDQLGNLVALRPEDGSSVWSDSSIQSFSGGIANLGGLSAGGGLVVATTDGSTVMGFDAATGRIRWRAAAPDIVDLPAAVAGDRVVLAAGDFAAALDSRTGRRLWTRRVGASVFAPPMVLGDTVAVLRNDDRVALLGLGDGGGRLVALGRPGPQADQDTELPMSWVDGALVIPTHNTGPWPFTILQAFPAPTVSGARPPRGVRLAGPIFGLPTSPNAAPALDGGRLYMSGLDFRGPSLRGTLYAATPIRSYSIGADSSLVLYRTTASADTGVPTVQGAVPAGDLILTQTGSDLVAVPRSGGPPAWVTPAGQPVPGTLPVVAGRTVVVPELGVGLAGIDRATGKPAWPTVPVRATASLGTPVLLPGGDVLWGAGGMTVIDPRTGKVVRQDTRLSSIGTMARDGGRVVGVVRVGKATALAALDPTSFAVQWAKPFDPARALGFLGLGPAAGDDMVVAVDSANVLRGYDGTTGNEAWSVPLRTTPSSDPAIVGGRVVVEEGGYGEDVNQREHRITVLDARTGAFEAQWEISGSYFSGFTLGITGGSIVVSSGSIVYAYHPVPR